MNSTDPFLLDISFPLLSYWYNPVLFRSTSYIMCIALLFRSIWELLFK